MKHQLLCTSAIALCVAASSAAAQEWDVKVGGFFTVESYMPDSGELMDGYEYGGLELKTDAELAASPSITLDNGLTVAASLQWELVGKADRHADQTFVTVSGPGLGSFRVGQHLGAGLSMTVGAPNVTHGGFNEWWIPNADHLKENEAGTNANAAGNKNGYVYDMMGGTAIDAGDYEIGAYAGSRITYKTPSFNGLTLGISYGPDGDSGRSQSVQREANKAGLATNIIDMGVGFSQSFGDANVSLSAAMGQATVNKRRMHSDRGSAEFTADDGGSLKNWSVGGSVTFGAITVGGTIAENNKLGAYENPTWTTVPASGNNVRSIANGDTDHSGMNFGVSYDAPGPWAFSVTMSQGTSSWKELAVGTGTNDVGTRANDRMIEREVDRTAFTLGAAQTLGSGVKWSIWYNSQERGQASASVFGSSLGISF